MKGNRGENSSKMAAGMQKHIARQWQLPIKSKNGARVSGGGVMNEAAAISAIGA
jgi:hypothetical protein